MIAQLPREPRRGEAPNSDQIAQIVRYLRFLTNYIMRLRPGSSRSGTAAPEVIRTFFTYDASTANVKKIRVTAGAINSVTWDDTAANVFTVRDGDQVYLHVTVTSDGVLTSVGVGVAATVPENTTSDGYRLIATVEIAASVMTITPRGWNYSEMLKCGPTIYLFGGFGE
jgi:hypothetical protein